MIRKVVSARIEWLPHSAGGRKVLPIGPAYSTVARFPEDEVNLSSQAWSLGVQFREGPRTTVENVLVHFLSPEAPITLLHPGSHFELMEGARVVARGEIIGEINEGIEDEKRDKVALVPTIVNN